MLEEIRHGFGDEFVGDCLFCLVFVRSLARERGGNKDKAVLNVLEAYFALVFEIFVVRFEVSVNLAYKGGFYRFFRRAAVFKVAGVMVIFNCLYFVGKAAGDLHFYFIFRFILAVASGSFALPELGSGEDSFFPGDFFDVVAYSVFINIFISFESAGKFLVAKDKNYSGVDYRLAFNNFLVPFKGNCGIGKNFVVGFPADF